MRGCLWYDGKNRSVLLLSDLVFPKNDEINMTMALNNSFLNKVVFNLTDVLDLLLT
jgi:hypothetical protein